MNDFLEGLFIMELANIVAERDRLMAERDWEAQRINMDCFCDDDKDKDEEWD